MFLANKYAKCYFALMEKRKSLTPDGYTETHHQIPKCLGGTDDEENLVRLSAREHFIAHLLLTKAVERKHRHKMAHAFWLMSHMVSANQERYTRINSATFSVVRALHVEGLSKNSKGKEYSEEMKARFRGPKSDHHRKKISDGKKGKLFSPEHKKSISNACKGRRWMSNESQTKMVSSVEEMETLLLHGWKNGRGGWSSR